MSDQLDNARLARILGPAEPEITCEECFEQLAVYFERERQGADAEAGVPGMRAHLKGCPACREDHDSLLAYLGTEPGW
jgi:hypothetical protein